MTTDPSAISKTASIHFAFVVPVMNRSLIFFHFFFSSFNDKIDNLLSTLNHIDCKMLELTDSYLTQTLLYGYTSIDAETNTLVL